MYPKTCKKNNAMSASLKTCKDTIVINVGTTYVAAKYSYYLLSSPKRPPNMLCQLYY